MKDKILYWSQWIPFIGFITAPYALFHGKKSVINQGRIIGPINGFYLGASTTSIILFLLAL